MMMAKLNRPNAEPIDLEELRTAGPDEAICLFSEETQEALRRQVPEEVRNEIGELLAALGDVVARIAPPAIRLDIRSGERWVGEVVIAGQRTLEKTGGEAFDDLAKLLLAMVYEVAEQAMRSAVAEDRDGVIKGYARATHDCGFSLERLRDSLRKGRPE